MVFMGTQLTLPFALAVSLHPHELISDPQQGCGMLLRRGAVSELIAGTFTASIRIAMQVIVKCCRAVNTPGFEPAFQACPPEQELSQIAIFIKAIQAVISKQPLP